MAKNRIRNTQNISNLRKVHVCDKGIELNQLFLVKSFGDLHTLNYKIYIYKKEAQKQNKRESKR